MAADSVPASAMTLVATRGVLSVFLSRCGMFVVLAPERTPTREAS
jgi:hypothetical protein